MQQTLKIATPSVSLEIRSCAFSLSNVAVLTAIAALSYKMLPF